MQPKKAKMEDMTLTNPELEYQGMIQDDNDVNDKISMMALSELLNDKRLKTISRVKPEQVPILTKLYMFSDIFGDSFTKNLANNILKLQISINGLSRREMVQLVQQRDNTTTDQPSRRQLKDIFR